MVKYSSMKKVVVYPDKILRVKTKIIEDFDGRLKSDVKDLAMALEKSYGVGLAGPQLGMDRRFFGLKDEKTKTVKVYINPKIEQVIGQKIYPIMVDEKGNQDEFLEGCLSFPDYWGTVKRYFKISASWQELNKGKLENKKEILEGLESIEFQHELDHLDGVLFIDHIKADGGKFYRWMGEKMVKWNLDEVIKGNL